MSFTYFGNKITIPDRCNIMVVVDGQEFLLSNEQGCLQIELLNGCELMGVDLDTPTGRGDHIVAGELRLYDEKEDIDERNAAAEDHSAEV